MTSDSVDGEEVTVVLPEGPPHLDKAGWRLLLGVLVNAARDELGPEWRSRLNAQRGT